MASAAFIADVFESNRGFLWGLCYRMTGNSADADDIVQETFVRTLKNPPPRTEEPLRPWLVRVAINLSRDYLRRRKRQDYVGTWLPSPAPSEEEPMASYEPAADPNESPSARYDLLESVTFAYLLALEALTPTQRAVLLLRDVFDYSTAETARALNITETTAKVTLHRARAAMKDYDAARKTPTTIVTEETKKALEQFLLYLSEADVKNLEKLLADDVVSIADGGGKVLASLRPIVGRRNVLRFYVGISKKPRGQARVGFQMLNGLPAVVLEYDEVGPRLAQKLTLQCEVDANGQINKLYLMVNPDKLSAIASL